MAFDNDAGMTANNSETAVARGTWVKPEIVSFEPVSAAQGSGNAVGEVVSNVS